jgi:hypothetical protein
MKIKYIVLTILFCALSSSALAWSLPWQKKPDVSPTQIQPKQINLYHVPAIPLRSFEIPAEGDCGVNYSPISVSATFLDFEATYGCVLNDDIARQITCPSGWIFGPAFNQPYKYWCASGERENTRANLNALQDVARRACSPVSTFDTFTSSTCLEGKLCGQFWCDLNQRTSNVCNGSDFSGGSFNIDDGRTVWLCGRRESR